MLNNQIERMKRELVEKGLFEIARKSSYEYIDNIFQRHVYPKDESLSKLNAFDGQLNAEGCNPFDIVRLLDKVGSENTVMQTGGRYFGFVNGGALPVCQAVKWITAIWDQNAVLHVASPVSAKIEEVCEKWIVDLLGLPKETVAGFVTGSSNAAFCALAAARDHQLEAAGWDIKKKGLFAAPEIKIYLSDQAHATIYKALHMLGFGEKNVVTLNSDNQGSIILNEIPAKIVPNSIFVLQAGNVNTGAYDTIDAIARIARKNRCWIHVDGAFGLWVAASTTLKHNVKGLELCDSWSLDAHKTLNVPYDCGIVLCRNQNALVSAMQATGDYIIHSQERDNMMYISDMSRRARGFELWAALKYLGKSGIAELVDRLHENTVVFGEKLEILGFTRLNTIVFNQLLVSYVNDEMTDEILEEIQKDGVCWCGGTKWKGKSAIRISVCNWSTSEYDIDVSVASFKKAASNVLTRMSEGAFSTRSDVSGSS